MTERGFIRPSISRVMNRGASAPGTRTGADDHVGLAQLVLENDRVGHQDPRPRAEVFVELVKAIERALQDRHLALGAEGDARRPHPDHSAADHDDPGGSDARDTTDQHAGAAERVLKEVRARVAASRPAISLMGERSGSTPVGGLDGFVGEPRAPELRSASVSGRLGARCR